MQEEDISPISGSPLQHGDVFNERYGPEGKYRASEHRFPFEDASFDFVILGSVFTRMLPADMENYFSEIGPVFAKEGEGRSLISFFLLNEEILELIEAQKSTVDSKHDMGRYRVMDADVPEYAVCHEESLVLGLCDKYGLRINHPIHYGSWRGRREFLSYQDLIVAEKT